MSMERPCSTAFCMTNVITSGLPSTSAWMPLSVTSTQLCALSYGAWLKHVPDFDKLTLVRPPMRAAMNSVWSVTCTQ